MSLIQRYRHKMPWPARSYMFFLQDVLYMRLLKKEVHILTFVQDAGLWFVLFQMVHWLMTKMWYRMTNRLSWHIWSFYSGYHPQKTEKGEKI